MDVFYDLKANAGQAAGPDGVTYDDLSRREAADLLRDLSRAVRNGAYRPGPGRRVSIAKPRGGYRTLTIRDVCYRVVSSALNIGMTPVWEPCFVSWSMGFRPDRSVLHLLAELEVVVTNQNRWVLAVDDIKKAFDNVPIDDVLADHRPYVRDPALLPLIEVVLRGGDDARAVGIDQGSAYSPTALNVRLHHAHDQHIDRCTVCPPRYRYADNLVYACRSVSEGRQAMNRSKDLLENAGFTLKGEDGPPTDLREGHRIQLLGFSLYEQDGKLSYGLGEDAWNKLEQNLLKVHGADDPTDAARSVVNGWIDAIGPAFESRRDVVLERVLTTAIGYGFREIDSKEFLLRRWGSSWGRWRRLRRDVRRQHHGGQRSEGVG